MNYKQKPIPAKAGIGFRHSHYIEIIEKLPEIAWLEIHSENFFADGGMPIHILEKVREKYPLSMHGVGLSLGSSDGLDKNHLVKLKKLVDEFNPALISEHISWSQTGGVFLNDLLPVPYTSEAIDVFVRNIKQMQDFLGRRILVENPSTYLEFNHSKMPEYEFLNQVADKAECGILCDVNNIYVCAINHKSNPEEYLRNIDHSKIGEVHLAGHATRALSSGDELLIDHHGDFVCDQVWQLYEKLITITGALPTLIEWDTDIPSLAILQGEAKKADEVMERILAKQKAC